MLATAKWSWEFKGHDFCTWVSRQDLKNYHQHQVRVLSLFSKVLPESYMEMKGKIGQCRCLETEMMDKPQSSRKEQSDSGYSISSQDRRGEHTADAWNTLWFFREGNKCKALEDCRGEAHVKTWEKPSAARILPEFSRQCWADGLSSMQGLKQGQRLSQSWTLKVMNDKVLTLLTEKDDAAS